MNSFGHFECFSKYIAAFTDDSHPVSLLRCWSAVKKRGKKIPTPDGFFYIFN